MTGGPAFIGVSLDSKSFSRNWVRSALAWILERHSSLLIVMADDLFYYTRTGIGCDVNFDRISDRVTSRRSEMEVFFHSEIDRLSVEDAARVKMARWADFSDQHYSRVLRFLRIAFEVVPYFQSVVCRLAAVHAERISETVIAPGKIRLCADFLLDETAMCLRITELGGFCSEYYPGNDISMLSELCSGRWAKSGLSIEALLGVQSRRCFTHLAF
jgi:tRNA-dependent cyclodipeptide synthase